MKKGGYREAGISSLSSGRGQVGFTVVETLIVLAVTGTIFLSAVVLISGKQSKTQFMAAINGLQQELQQVITQTANGYYPRDTSFSCARGASTPPTLTVQTSGDRQGQNPDCIFLGKVLQFAVQGTNPETYQVYPMVGNRMDSTGTAEASTLYGSTGTLPIAAAPGNSAATNSGIPTAALTVRLSQGLNVVRMWYGTNTTDTTGTVGFISTLPSADGAGVASGTQRLALYTVLGSARGQTAGTAVDYMYPGVHNAAPLVATSLVSICVASGTTDQSGLITIGQSDNSSSSSLAVNLAIRTGLTC